MRERKREGGEKREKEGGGERKEGKREREREGKKIYIACYCVHNTLHVVITSLVRVIVQK